MTPATIDQHLQAGIQHHQAGRLSEAEAIYRQVLSLQPSHAHALHLLGVVSLHTGQLEFAIESIRKSIALNPSNAQAYCNLSVALCQTNRFDDAIAACREAIRIDPAFAEARNNLGLALQGKGELHEAIATFREAIRLKPEDAAGHANLGNTLRAAGQLDEAVLESREAARIKPNYAEAHNNLGIALSELGKYEEAAGALRQAIALRPDLAQAQCNLGIALLEVGQLDEGMAACDVAIRLMEDRSVPNSELAAAYVARGRLLTEMGRVKEAIASFRRAVELAPGEPRFHDNLVFTLNYSPDYDGPAILREARKWDERHGKPLRYLIRPHNNNRDPDRRLRVGYVSADFGQHVVGHNLLPLLSEHSSEQVEVFCYNGLSRPDAMTERLRAHSDHWRDVARLSDEQLAKQIREDQIDILIDLSLFTAHHRLGTFAIIPAPVQITYLGYCGTSGIEGMQYRFSDPHLDPLDQDLSQYSEKTIRLPETYWCYSPGDETPAVSPLPADKNGHITFGCLNKFPKVSPRALELWCEILDRVPKSRLIIHALPSTHLQAVRENISGRGISAQRVEFIGRQSWDQYMRTFHRIDIGLDPFPYNGGITTCDMLWMGVPTVSLSGNTSVARAGRSILSNVSLPELIAYDGAQYVKIAAGLANDRKRLSNLRRTLRERMKGSPLMDAPRFARNVEAAYRDVWQRWCSNDPR